MAPGISGRKISSQDFIFMTVKVAMKNLLMAMLALLLMAGCSPEPTQPVKTEKPQPKPPEFVTGRTAFQKLYIAAHGWARDAQPYRLESMVTADSKGREGKAAVWRASFGSALQRGVKPYIWSGEDSQDAPSRGINPGTEDNYNPTNSSTHIFDVAFLKLDSDKALEVAQKHGGDKLLAKEPDTPILYMVDWSNPTSELIWHVIYGTNPYEAKLKVAVNASTGDFLRVEK
jgi:hypothetical protein